MLYIIIATSTCFGVSGRDGAELGDFFGESSGCSRRQQREARKTRGYGDGLGRF